MPPISSAISRISAAYLLIGGVALLFASDALLPRFVPGFPPEAVWIGQLLAAAWLGAAFVNWNGRANVLGGVYGRPIIGLNLCVFLVGALSLVKAPLTAPVFWAVALPMTLLALAYGMLLLRGPFDAK